MNIVESLRVNTPPSSGVYVAVVTDSVQPINDVRRRGVRFEVEVAEGPHSGRRAVIELTTELKVGGNRSRMLSDLLALEAWIIALGVDIDIDSSATPTEMIAKLRDAAIGRRVEFKLECNHWKGRVYVNLVGVRLAPESRADG